MKRWIHICIIVMAVVLGVLLIACLVTIHKNNEAIMLENYREHLKTLSAREVLEEYFATRDIRKLKCIISERLRPGFRVRSKDFVVISISDVTDERKQELETATYGSVLLEAFNAGMPIAVFRVIFTVGYDDNPNERQDWAFSFIKPDENSSWQLLDSGDYWI